MYERLVGTPEFAVPSSHMEGEWKHHSPKAIIDGLIAAVPDALPRYTFDELPTIPLNDPSALELYFLSHLPNFSVLSDEEGPKGSLSARRSIEACLRDEVRTKVFFQGISEVIGQLEISTEPSRAIEVFDAGAGASAALSIYAALCSERVHCTAIELNPESVAIARSLVKAFSLEDRIDVIEADARTFKPKVPIDLLVSETMDSALTREPLVEIMSNLQPNVRQGGITLPSGIKVSASLISREAYSNPDEYVVIAGVPYPVMPAYTTRWQEVALYSPGDKLDVINFSLYATGLPRGEYHVLVNSEVEVVPGRTLGPYASFISMPQTIEAIDDDIQFADYYLLGSSYYQGVRVSYKPGEEPIDKAWPIRR